jgi:hypothetical protein
MFYNCIYRHNAVEKGDQSHVYDFPSANPTVELKLQESAAYGKVSSGENCKSEVRMKESRAYISVTSQKTAGISLYDSVQ